MSVQWQGFFTSLTRALDALGGIPPTPTSPGVLAQAYKGNWSGTETYYPGDEVSSGGNIWRSLLESLNVTPASGAYWLLIGPLTLDWIAQGGTYGTVKQTGLSSGVVTTQGLVSGAACDVISSSVSNVAIGYSASGPYITDLTSVSVGPYPFATTLIVTILGTIEDKDATNNTYVLFPVYAGAGHTVDIFYTGIGTSGGDPLVYIAASQSQSFSAETEYALAANTSVTFQASAETNNAKTPSTVADAIKLKVEVIKR